LPVSGRGNLPFRIPIALLRNQKAALSGRRRHYRHFNRRRQQKSPEFPAWHGCAAGIAAGFFFDFGAFPG
jgi:hypothetical protein